MLYNFQIHWRAWFGGPYLRPTNSWGKKQTEKGLDGKGQQLAYGLPPTETSFQKWMTFDHSNVTSVWGSHPKSLPLQLCPHKDLCQHGGFSPKNLLPSPPKLPEKTSTNFFWGSKKKKKTSAIQVSAKGLLILSSFKTSYDGHGCGSRLRKFNSKPHRWGSHGGAVVEKRNQKCRRFETHQLKSHYLNNKGFLAPSKRWLIGISEPSTVWFFDAFFFRAREAMKIPRIHVISVPGPCRSLSSLPLMLVCWIKANQSHAKYEHKDDILR